MSEIPPPTVPPVTPLPPGGGSYVPPPPPPGPTGPVPASDRTMMLVLSYLWFLSIVPLVTKKEDPEIQWHAKNGLVLAIAVTAVDIFFMIFGHFFPLLSCALSFIPCAIGVGYLVVTIIGIMKALKGERLRIPGISNYADTM